MAPIYGTLLTLPGVGWSFTSQVTNQPGPAGTSLSIPSTVWLKGFEQLKLETNLAGYTVGGSEIPGQPPGMYQILYLNNGISTGAGCLPSTVGYVFGFQNFWIGQSGPIVNVILKGPQKLETRFLDGHQLPQMHFAIVPPLLKKATRKGKDQVA